MLTLLFYALMGILLAFIIRCSIWRHKYSQLMPGSKPRFFDFLADAKEILSFSDESPDNSILLKFMDALKKRNKIFQKEHSLFSAWLLYTPFIFIVKADSVKEVLTQNNMKEKSWVYEFLKPVFGYGLATRPHAAWKPRRKQINRCFHPDILRGFLPIFNENAQNLVQYFSKYENKYAEIYHPVALCALDIICETVFDLKLENLKTESQFAKLVQRGSELLINRLISFWQWPDILFWNLPSGRELKSCIKNGREFTEEIIRKKKMQYSSTRPETYSRKRQALIDLLMQMQMVEHELTEEDVKNEVDTFVLGGYDTTASAITWTLYMIGLYPNIQAKIHQELDSIFGADVEKPITEDDLNLLHYLDCVIKETLRLYPSVPIFGRQAEEETNICGSIIPKGTSCFILAYFLHRDEDVFPDPENFDPDRFLPENFKRIPEGAYIPFSLGSRNCIGYRFGIMEAKILVATILRNFTLESLDDRSKVRPVMQIILHFSSPVYLKFSPRVQKEI